MENKTKESISRILLIVFWLMLVILLMIMSSAGTIVPFYACLGLVLIVILLIGIGKHRKYVCIGMTVILLLVMVDHFTGRILYQERIKSCYDRIEELEIIMAEYENTSDEHPLKSSEYGNGLKM